jgi:hypothetical protein
MTAPGKGLAVLTATSTVTCAHTGTVGADKTSRLRVGKQSVLLADVTGKDITGCTVVDDTSHGIKKCLKVSSVTIGQSSKLTVGDKSVLLASLAGFSDGTPPPPPTGVPLPPVAANQTRLRAAAAVT